MENTRGRASIAQWRERFAEGLEQLRSEEGFRNWLEAAKRFHTYSARNALLIMLQRPKATYVAGYRAWQRLGYQVRKGEHGIGIWVPMLVKVEEAGEGEAERRRIFRVGHVFDRSQVDPIEGKAQPIDPPAPAPIDGDSHGHLLERLKQFAARRGYGVVESTDPAYKPDGSYNRRTREITLRAEQSVNSKAAVMAHELAHALAAGEKGLSYAREEAVVEAAAFIVCARFGLDVEANSVPYVGAWAREDSKVIERDAELIERLAGEIEAGVGGEDSEASEDVALRAA